ncbi:hypothetical protein FQZ97_863360 [compost metagenome]
MQDWADRLDLLEQGEVNAASTHLMIRIDGMPVLDEGARALADSIESGASPILLSSVAGALAKRLSAAPIQPEPIPMAEAVVSEVQRERMELLETYESPHNLPVVQFARLAGKSRDQINREIKAGKLLTLSMGTRGQRIPDWQLDPLKQGLVQAVLMRAEVVDSWRLYELLLQPRGSLEGRSAIESVSLANIHEVVQMVSSDLARDRYPVGEWRSFL